MELDFIPALCHTRDPVLNGVQRKKRYQSALRQSILEQLSTVRARLEGEFNTELSLSTSIITDIVINTDISKERFFKITRHFLKSAKYIRNIGLAKNTTLTYVYPEKGNEKAIGLDYTKIPSQWPAVKRAIQEHQIVVAGPLNLVQGTGGCNENPAHPSLA